MVLNNHIINNDIYWTKLCYGIEKSYQTEEILNEEFKKYLNIIDLNEDYPINIII